MYCFLYSFSSFPRHILQSDYKKIYQKRSVRKVYEDISKQFGEKKKQRIVLIEPNEREKERT